MVLKLVIDIFLVCGLKMILKKILSLARDKIAKDLNLIDENQFSLLDEVDYPMFEYDQTSKKSYLVTIHFYATR